MAEAVKEKLIDLHFHSNYSDGSENIVSIIKEVIEKNLIALALTDHNEDSGIYQLSSFVERLGLMYFEGTEIYVTFPETTWSMNPDKAGPAPDAVILGRFLDWAPFRAYQEDLKEYRFKHWLPATLEWLRLAGLEVPVLNEDEMRRQANNLGTPSILHEVPNNPRNWPIIFEIVSQFEKTTLESIDEKSAVRFANKYLYAIGRQAYVKRGSPNCMVADAARMAKDMNGILFAGHPGGDYGAWSPEHLDYFVENGGRGIEVWQFYHSQEQIRFFLEYAIQHDLLVSGGSDWHGKNGRAGLGCWNKPENQTPLWVADYLWERLP